MKLSKMQMFVIGSILVLISVFYVSIVKKTLFLSPDGFPYILLFLGGLLIGGSSKKEEDD